MKGKNIYEIVTNSIINILEQQKAGTFNKPWVIINNGLAENPNSGTVYKGINQFFLSLNGYWAGYTANKWLTFKQVQALQARVKKGETASEIIFSEFVYYDEKGNRYTKEQARQLSAQEQKKLKKVFFAKYYNVYNVAQITGLPDAYYETTELYKPNHWERCHIAEDIIHATGAKIEHREQSRAYYSKATDSIVMPVDKQFRDKDGYYEVVLHELSHWTGFETRLNRTTLMENSPENYAVEELIAELSSAFLCASLGMDRQISNSAAYLDSWLKELRENERFIFRVMAQAQRASEFILKFKESAIGVS